MPNRTYKLKACWNTELAQDLNAYHMIDDHDDAITIMNMPDGVMPGDMLKLTRLTFESFSAVYVGPLGRGPGTEGSSRNHVLFMSGRPVNAYMSEDFDLWGPRHRVTIASKLQDASGD